MGASVNLLIQNSGGKFLLQMRDNNPGICSPLKWCLFGGSIEEGEEIIEAAKRELEEELGITTNISDYELRSEVEFDDLVVHVVRYKKALEWGEFRVNEGAGAGFFPYDDLKHLDLAPKLLEIIKHINYGKRDGQFTRTQSTVSNSR